jgi:branched-chain amino acid transport system permease protein
MGQGLKSKPISIMGIGLLLGGGLVLLPLGIHGYWLHIVMEIIILALFATSLNLVVGYTGMISFGHAGFYGIGLYVVAGL